MIKSSIMKMRKLSLIYNFVFLHLLFSWDANAQRVQKTFEKEIVVSPDVTIKTKGLEGIPFSGNGSIYYRPTKGHFILSAGTKKPHIYKAQQVLEIKTWDRDAIKQVVEVSVECENQADADQLLNRLNIKLEENAAGIVDVGCKLNINDFWIQNGWFREDRNYLILNNGEQHDVQYFEWKNTLYIPKKSNIIINSEDGHFEIKDHLGTVNFNLIHGSLQVKNINEIQGQCENANVGLRDINKGRLNIKNSSINVFGAQSVGIQSSLSNYFIHQVEALEITNSLSDVFLIDSVEVLNILSAPFSEFFIDGLGEQGIFYLKNSNVAINGVGENAQLIFVENENGKVALDIGNIESYKIIAENINQCDYKIVPLLEPTASNENQSVYSKGNDPFQLNVEFNIKQCEVWLQDTKISIKEFFNNRQYVGNRNWLIE